MWALWTWAMDAAATGSLKDRNSSRTGLPKAASTTRIACSCGKGRNPVLQLLEIEGGIHADDVGPRRQELAELDVGGAEPRQSALQRTRPCAEARPFQHPPELQGEAQMRAATRWGR